MPPSPTEIKKDLQVTYAATYGLDLDHDEVIAEFEQQLALAIQTAQRTFPEAQDDFYSNPTQIAYVRTLLMEIEDQPDNQI